MSFKRSANIFLMDKIGQVFDDTGSFLDFEVYLLVESSAKHMLPEAVKLVSK